MTHEEKERILYALDYVCDEKRVNLAKPFIRGEYLYATNGRVIVRRRLQEADKPFFVAYAEREGSPTQETMERFFGKEQMHGLPWFAERAGSVWTALVECRKKHCDTQQEELRNLEHYTCPCCDTRVYLDGDTLVDEDTAERTLITRYGIEVVAGEEKLTFAGDPVYDAVDCVRRLGAVMDIGIKDRNLLIIGLGFDCLIAGSHEPWLAVDEPKHEIVGTFELKKENE